MRYATSVLLIVLISTGCQTTAEFAPLSEKVYPPLPVEATIQLTTGDLTETYEELAVITVWADRSWWTPNVLERLNERLREQARALGADAVIRIDYTMQEGSGDTDLKQSATGTAVRTNNAS